MKYQVQYHESVVRVDIPRLSPKIRESIKKSIEDKLTSRPEVFGKPLRKSLKGYRKLRVSDYRVVFRIEDKIIKIFMIQHRSAVYGKVKIRIIK